MKILVINCSPKGDASDCLKLTRAFLEGINETAETINAVDLSIKPCRGCYACWRATPGKCVQNDDMPPVLEKLAHSDLVIWSAPLYCYGLPAIGKAIIDRLLPLTCPEQEATENGGTRHPDRQTCRTRFMLISGCGFPNIDNNYEAMLLHFGMTFHDADFPRITCVEAPLLSIPEAAPVALPYLERVRAAGAEFKRDGAISKATQAYLDSPMFPPETYRAMTRERRG